jgi:hypothetical protein
MITVDLMYVCTYTHDAMVSFYGECLHGARQHLVCCVFRNKKTILFIERFF